MLVNPYETRLATYEGTRLLKDTLGVVGVGVRDGADPRRTWVIQGLYSPAPRRNLGGLRARLVDAKDFVTFINQRDLEVLLGIALPGQICSWSKTSYALPGSKDWFGFCMDREDLMDDLLDRELFIRGFHQGQLPVGSEIRRKLHMDVGSEVEECLTSLWDMDPETGECPDRKLSTVDGRWARIYSTRI